ncbi:unnamed protein product [Symbiodinium necroappetens]|uniref:1-phosphatidylinositol phosphodiesterase n=1 Tax=Symbiodinium necroappetens TaxID=1628268 RepID=A0A812YZ47_9DINO|nr:unnamed protein product [Symbiodinium necroappetens]
MIPKKPEASPKHVGSTVCCASAGRCSMKVICGFLPVFASQSTGTLAVEPGNSVRSPYADVRLTSWPMLTTHDAATGYMQNPLDPRVTWGQTQPASKHAFTEQLNCGARAFDMRPHVTDEGKVVFHHGDVEIMQDAETAVAEIVQWAQQHPALEDFVLIYNWDCTGASCSTKVAELLAKYGLATMANCSQLNLTLSAAASMASLPHGGHVLVVNDCVQQHYNESLACSGFDQSFDASDIADLAGNLPHCRELHNASLDELLLCGHQLQQRHAAAAPTSAVGYYQCWVGASGHDFAVQRLLGYLTGVASKPLPADSFTELQALWQETPQSVAIGVAHFNSLLKDEEQSQLNALMAQKIRSGAFGHISLFEVNNVCDHGLEMVAFVEPLVLSETVPCARGELLQFKEASAEASYLGACCGLVCVKAGSYYDKFWEATGEDSMGQSTPPATNRWRRWQESGTGGVSSGDQETFGASHGLGSRRGGRRGGNEHWSWKSERGCAPSSRLGQTELDETIRDYVTAPEEEEEKGVVKVAGSGAGAERKGPGRISNTYPPVFRARPQESYQEWRRSVEFWVGGEGNQLPVELIGPRMMVQLKDRAAQLVKHLQIADVHGLDGKEVIFRELEKSPLISRWTATVWMSTGGGSCSSPEHRENPWRATRSMSGTCWIMLA